MTTLALLALLLEAFSEVCLPAPASTASPNAARNNVPLTMTALLHFPRRLPARDSGLDKLTKVAPDLGIGLVGKIRERHARGPRRAIEAAAVEQHGPAARHREDQIEWAQLLVEV